MIILLVLLFSLSYLSRIPASAPSSHSPSLSSPPTFLVSFLSFLISLLTPLLGASARKAPASVPSTTRSGWSGATSSRWECARRTFSFHAREGRCGMRCWRGTRGELSRFSLVCKSSSPMPALTFAPAHTLVPVPVAYAMVINLHTR